MPPFQWSPITTTWKVLRSSGGAIPGSAPDLAFLGIQKAFLTPELEAKTHYPQPPSRSRRAPCDEEPWLPTSPLQELDGPLDIQPNMLAEQADLEVLVAGFELALDLASQSAYRDITKRWIVPAKRLGRRELIDFIRMGAQVTTTPSALAPWVGVRTLSSTANYGSTESTACASPMPRLCPTSLGLIQTPHA